jgi:DNA-directed RNA polymerase subunit RPC12/RpoP
MNTDCRKCKAAMPPTMPVKFGQGVMSRLEIKITGYRCPHCDHWNNLKTRKPRKSSVV